MAAEAGASYSEALILIAADESLTSLSDFPLPLLSFTKNREAQKASNTKGAADLIRSKRSVHLFTLHIHICFLSPWFKSTSVSRVFGTDWNHNMFSSNYRLRVGVCKNRKGAGMGRSPWSWQLRLRVCELQSFSRYSCTTWAESSPTFKCYTSPVWGTRRLLI